MRTEINKDEENNMAASTRPATTTTTTALPPLSQADEKRLLDEHKSIDESVRIKDELTQAVKDYRKTLPFLPLLATHRKDYLNRIKGLIKQSTTPKNMYDICVEIEKVKNESHKFDGDKERGEFNNFIDKINGILNPVLHEMIQLIKILKKELNLKEALPFADFLKEQRKRSAMKLDYDIRREKLIRDIDAYLSHYDDRKKAWKKEQTVISEEIDIRYFRWKNSDHMKWKERERVLKEAADKLRDSQSFQEIESEIKEHNEAYCPEWLPACQLLRQEYDEVTNKWVEYERKKANTVVNTQPVQEIQSNIHLVLPASRDFFSNTDLTEYLKKLEICLSKLKELRDFTLFLDIVRSCPEATHHPSAPSLESSSSSSSSSPRPLHSPTGEAPKSTSSDSKNERSATGIGTAHIAGSLKISLSAASSSASTSAAITSSDSVGHTPPAMVVAHESDHVDHMSHAGRRPSRS